MNKCLWNKCLWTILTITALGLAGCGGGGQPSGSAPTTSSSGMGSSGSGTSGSGTSGTAASGPTDFAVFVISQMSVGATPSLAPASLDSMNGDWALDDATAFNQIIFGNGDALPAGTYQGAVACAEAGTSACNPGVSADLNSSLN